MAKVKAEVLNAVVDGKRKGEQIELDEKSAEYLSGIGYVKVVAKVTTKPVKKKPAPKKQAATKAKSK